jgi:hypothetical protein
MKKIATILLALGAAVLMCCSCTKAETCKCTTTEWKDGNVVKTKNETFSKDSGNCRTSIHTTTENGKKTGTVKECQF